MTERELKKLAKKKGFIKTAFGKGSHEVWKHPDGRTVTIHKPKENDYRPGTLGKILKVLEGEYKTPSPILGRSLVIIRL